jgi:MFS family permease
VRGNGHGWTSPQVLTALIAGGVLVVAFVAWQARARNPMVPLELFRDRGFSVVNGVALVMAFGMFGSVFLGAQYMQTVLGYSPLEAGVRTLPWTAVPAVAAPIAGLLMDRVGARRIVAVALALQAIGIGWLAAQSTVDATYPSLVPPFVIAGLGMGLFFAPMARLTLGFAPRHLEGVASGTSNALRQLGTVLGVAVLGSIFSAYGGFGTPASFVDGLTPAMWVGRDRARLRRRAGPAGPRGTPPPRPRSRPWSRSSRPPPPDLSACKESFQALFARKDSLAGVVSAVRSRLPVEAGQQLAGLVGLAGSTVIAYWDACRLLREVKSRWPRVAACATAPKPPLYT